MTDRTRIIAVANEKGGAYTASYALARGDIYMQLDRPDDARNAYTEAKLALAQSAADGRIPTLEQKLQSLNPVPARAVQLSAEPADEVDNPDAAEPLETQGS